jgi:hypothetical protein
MIVSTKYGVSSGFSKEQKAFTELIGYTFLLGPYKIIILSYSFEKLFHMIEHMK